VTEPEFSTLLAPAKLTLSLQVTGVRADGYHLLDAEMVSIDLADTVEITDGGAGITTVDEVVGGQGASGVPSGDQNLVSRALDLLGRKASIRLVKRIPPGAGLGGGSADAAAVLRWAGRTEVALAVRLGADVPFCLRGGRARVRGIGEVVEALAFEDRRFMLLLPPFSVSTAAVYAAWDEGHRLAEHRGRDAGGLRDDGARETRNDLEPAALEVAPQLARWRDCLFRATGIRPRLAGSGSTWFVEGDPASTGLEGRHFLTLGHERASLVPVRTIPPQLVR
jgi:4-diphosphocytidyl-2-C-methyl-D-erythritol kinase